MSSYQAANAAESELTGLELTRNAVAAARAKNAETNRTKTVEAIQKEGVEMDRQHAARISVVPDPLRGELEPASPYPIDALGDVLGGAVKAYHETIKAPLELCAQSVLAAASFAVQAHFDVAMPWGETKPTTLFFLTVGGSGERKSGVDDAVLGAAKEQVKQDLADYEAVYKDYLVKLQAWQDANEAAKAEAKKAGGKVGGASAKHFENAYRDVGEKPDAPIYPIGFVSDPTVEGLFKLLMVSQPSVALFSDEGGLLIGGHAMNSENVLKTMSRWCKLWDGSPYDRVRAGDGAGTLYGRRMALHQLAQPEVMSSLLDNSLANGQGFLARCLVAWPESTIGSRQVERFLNPKDRPEARKLYGKLKSLFEAPPSTNPLNQRELTPYALKLSKDASNLALKASNEFENLMKPGAELSELKDRTSKALDNALRLAAVLAVIDQGIGCREISAEHVCRGLDLIQWYLGEALRIKSASYVTQEIQDAETLIGWLKNKGIRLFRSKQVLKDGPNHLRSKPRFDKAIEVLTNSGWIETNKEGVEVDGVIAKRSWRVSDHVL